MGRTARLGLLPAIALLVCGCAPAPGEPAAPLTANAAAPPVSLETPDTKWIASWGTAAGSADTARDSRYRRIKFRNLTIRQVVRLSAGGEAVRVRLTNEFGEAPLLIGAASLALTDASGAPIETTRHPLTFAGLPSATIPAGAAFLTDPVALPVDDLSQLSISLYLPTRPQSCSCHETALATSEISPPGDYTATAFDPIRTTTYRAFITGIEVLAPAPAHTIVALGDSITDGMGSTLDANQRWPDILAERLAARQHDTTWAVVNAGISGNKLLEKAGGDSALSRFTRDVLARPGVTHVIVFIGVNDLGHAFRDGKNLLSANDMIAGYRQLIARARENNLSIIGATIAPYGDAAFFWSPAGEAARQAINDWIRNSGEFDAVFDFAAALADPADPTRMAAPLQSDDNLHASDAGYRAIANAIDLSLFD